MRSKTVEDAAHLYDRAGEFDLFAEDFGAIRRRKYGLADIETDFAPVDIERGNDLNVAWLIGADLAMHQSVA